MAALVMVQPMGAVAQSDEAPALRQPTIIRWWHGVIVLGGLSGLMLLDNPTQRFSQDHRTEAKDDFARTVRHMGQPEVYGTITLGLIGGGLISGHGELARSGARLGGSLLTAGAVSTLSKLALGRPRPNESLDADGYVPFSGQDAMPSGHTTMAFALATSLGDDIHRTWASIGLYTLAAGVGWSRINDNKHWLSDVAAGAVVGVTSSKLATGRWRIFNLRPPAFLIAPGYSSLTWNVEF